MSYDLVNNILFTDSEEWRKDYWCKPVSFETFITDKYHLNLKPLSPKQLEALFALIGEDPLQVFSHNRKKHVGVYLWGKGCVAGSTILRDEISGKETTIEELCKNTETINIKCYDEDANEDRVVEIEVPFTKGEAEMFEVMLGSGQKITVTREHQFLTRSGWKKLLELDISDAIKVGAGYSTVIASESKGFQEVYDIDVPEFHNYYAHDILNHNSGKDYVTSILQAYLLYLLLCMKDPHDYFNFPKAEGIVLVNIAPTAAQAKRIFFAKFTSRIKNWKWLSDNFKVFDRGAQVPNSSGNRLEVRITDSSVDVSNQISCLSLHSESGNFEGYNILFFCGDEIAEFDDKFETIMDGDEQINVGKADLIYNTLITSAASRKLPWLGVLISFPRRIDDFIMRKYQEAVDDPDGMLIARRGCTWEFNPLYEGEKTFKFETWDVPISLKKQFENDPSNSRLKFCTVPPITLNRFFYNDERIQAAIDLNIKPLVDVQDDILEIDDANNKKVKFAIKKIMAARIIDRSKAYAIHVDLSISSDSTTVVIGHGEPCDIQSTFVGLDGKQELKTLHTRVVIDQIFVWAPDKKKQVVVSHINVDETIESLVGLTGCSYISWDQYQSQYTLEKAIRNGIDCEKSNIKTGDYSLFRNMLWAGAVSYPKHPKFIFELERIIWDGKRPDHLPIFCFTGDTKVSLTDGREVSMEDLVIEHNNGKQNYVYSVNNESNRIQAKPIKNAFCSGFSKILKVTLDNGEQIKCTPNHRFMLRNGEYKEAKDLVAGESLMPLYRKKDQYGYEKILNVFTNRYIYTHTTGKNNANYRHGRFVKSKISNPVNHKVSSVEECGYAKVYDLEIPDTHNFALSAGVFVHNSKDIVDSVIGVTRAIAEGKARTHDPLIYDFFESKVFSGMTMDDGEYKPAIPLPSDALPQTIQFFEQQQAQESFNVGEPDFSGVTNPFANDNEGSNWFI
jgi:hypothetical protein